MPTTTTAAVLLLAGLLGLGLAPRRRGSPTTLTDEQRAHIITLLEGTHTRPQAFELIRGLGLVLQPFLWTLPTTVPSANSARFLKAASTRFPPKIRWTVANARALVELWLRERQFKQDRWGAWVKPNGRHRWKLKKTVVEFQNRRYPRASGPWVKQGSRPLVDLALHVYELSAKEAGDPQAEAQADAWQAARTAKAAKAKARADAKKYKAAAREAAAGELLAEIRDEGRIPEMEELHAKRTYDRDKIAAFNARLDARQDLLVKRFSASGHPPHEVRAKLRDDGARYSLARPPYPWLGGDYRWEEGGNSVVFDMSGDMPVWWVGGGGDLYQDPSTLRIAPARGIWHDRRGPDGFIAGAVLRPQTRGNAHPLVTVTMVSADDPSPLVRSAMQIAKGYGGDTILVAYLTDKDHALWDQIATETGLQLIGSDAGQRLYALP